MQETRLSDFEALCDQLAGFFLDRADVQVPSVDTDLIDAGYLDSLTFVELVLYLEQDLGARFSVDELGLDAMRSIERIALFVQNHVDLDGVDAEVHQGNDRVRKAKPLKTLQEIASTLRDTEFPRQITIELCAYCNLECIMCPHPTMQREKGFMSDDLYRKCIDEIAENDVDTQVWLADHGESLIIGEEIVGKVRYAKSKGLTQVYLNTNGMLLTPEISRGLIDAGLDGLFFGIDAATKETHAAIRRGGDLDTVVRNVEYIAQEVVRQGRDKPEVWVQFIEMDENEHERQLFAEYWKDKNVGVKIRRKLSWGGYIESSAVRRAATERIPCPWIMNLMHILWDGRVGRCTGDHECNHPMGNVYESTIKEIWTGPLRRERQLHLDYRFDLLNEQCQQCVDWAVGAAERRPSILA